MKTGLVLEGGGMRGLYTSGILDVFMENGITADGAVGVSAGAVFGCNLKSHQHGRGIRYNLKYSSYWRYKGLRSLILTGDAFGAEFCYHTLPNELDRFDTEAFMADPMEFYAVATDIVRGEPVYHKLNDAGFEDMEWVRASASMPLVSNIVSIGDQKLLDGGITDSIPLKFMEEKGYDRNIVILTQPIDYVKKPYKIMPFVKASLHKYPEVVKRIADRHEMYNAQTRYVREKEADGSIFVIRPKSALNISAMEKDTKELQRVYDHGREVGLEVIEGVKSFLAK